MRPRLSRPRAAVCAGLKSDIRGFEASPRSLFQTPMHVRDRQFLSLAAVLGVLAPTFSSAQVAHRQTEPERRLAAQCYQRSDAHLNNPFSYPLTVGASPDGKSLGVSVAPEKWNALTEVARIALLRDVACWYAGGRLERRYWYDFSAVDPGTERTIETIRGPQLWPGRSYR